MMSTMITLPLSRRTSVSTTTKEGYRQYFSHPTYCKDCPLLSYYTQSQKYQEILKRLVWEDCIEEAELLLYTEVNKLIYARRKETIERVFPDARKVWKALDYFKRT